MKATKSMKKNAQTGNHAQTSAPLRLCESKFQLTLLPLRRKPATIQTETYFYVLQTGIQSLVDIPRVRIKAVSFLSRAVQRSKQHEQR
jgi:hypothetical protein